MWYGGWCWVDFMCIFFRILSCDGCKGEDRVIQPTEDVFASEGDTVTLDCQFETSTTPHLPEFLLYITEGGTIHPTDSDFSAYINKTEKRVNLEISSAALTDSAVYYCALKPTTCLCDQAPPSNL
uniref:Ig-like domain-containing protein n=1 Tax=Labrus bergylta TaxID=56723 RepID=A0A3Q3FVR9_9LABR